MLIIVFQCDERASSPFVGFGACEHGGGRMGTRGKIIEKRHDLVIGKSMKTDAGNLIHSGQTSAVRTPAAPQKIKELRPAISRDRDEIRCACRACEVRRVAFAAGDAREIAAPVVTWSEIEGRRRIARRASLVTRHSSLAARLHPHRSDGRRRHLRHPRWVWDGDLERDRHFDLAPTVVPSSD